MLLTVGGQSSFDDICMEKISPEEVRAAVAKFWSMFMGKTRTGFENLYFPNSAVFSSTATRTEPGRLTVIRRVRQFFDSPVELKAELGSVEVQCAGPNVAIASYAYAVHITSKAPDKTRLRRTSPFSRATQIFQRDSDGALRIIHEHMSSATPPTEETLPAE